jgi:hypothetical protein
MFLLNLCLLRRVCWTYAPKHAEHSMSPVDATLGHDILRDGRDPSNVCTLPQILMLMINITNIWRNIRI